MPTLSDQQIAQYAYNAGFRGDSLNTAVAVALAESHGNPSNIGDVGLQNGTWGPSVGLWQIRSLNPGHGTAAEQALRNQQDNLDPATNAQHAYAISQQGTNFGPWSTYTNGAYRQYTDRARTAGQTVTPAGSSSSSGSFRATPSALTSTAGDFSDQATRLQSVNRELSADSLTTQAFGGVPQSGQAYQKHRSALDTLIQDISAKLTRTGVLATGLNNSADNYIQGDQGAALGYQSLST